MSHTKTVHALTLEGAKAMAAAAEAEAARNGWNVCIAVVDAGGGLIVFHRIESTQVASEAIAIGKARTAARFKRPTKMLEESVANGRLAILSLEDVVPMQGGLPVIVDGQVIGAVGVSGVTAAQDEQVAQAGIAALAR